MNDRKYMFVLETGHYLDPLSLCISNLTKAKGCPGCPGCPQSSIIFSKVEIPLYHIIIFYLRVFLVLSFKKGKFFPRLN